MPTHHGNQLYIFGTPEDCDESAEDYWRQQLAKPLSEPHAHYLSGLVDLMVPVELTPTGPYETHDFWLRRRYGCFVDTCNHTLRRMHGDVHGVILDFEARSCTIPLDTRELMAAWLLSRGARRVVWLELSPMEDLRVLGSWCHGPRKGEE